MPLLSALRRSFLRVWLRFLVLVLSPFFLAFASVLLYAFLPFPVPPDLELDTRERLSEGRWVTRVYWADELLRYRINDDAGLYNQHERAYFSLTFAHSPSSPFTLSFLSPNNTLTQVTIPVGLPAEQASSGARIPTLPGDPDGVSLPWFAEPDAAILWGSGAQYLPDRKREQDATLLVATTAIASDPEWASGEGTVTFTIHAASHPADPLPVIPLLSMHLLPGNATHREIARVAFSPDAEGKPTVFAPSYTLPLRVAILDFIIFCVFAAEEAIKLAIELALWFAGMLGLVVTGWILSVVWTEQRGRGGVVLRSPTFGVGSKGFMDSPLPVVIVTEDGKFQGM